MRTRHLTRGIALGASLLASQFTSAQEVIYSNMTASDPFNYGAGSTWVITDFRTTGARITSSAATDLPLGSVVAPMSTVCLYVATVCQTPPAGTTMQVWLDIFADNNNVPGVLLARSEVVAVSTVGMPYTFSFAAGTVLQAGASYWVKSNTSSPASLGAGWAWNQQGRTGVAVWLAGTYSTTFQGAEVALSVTPVPEPAQWLMLLSALPLLLLRLRHGYGDRP